MNTTSHSFWNQLRSRSDADFPLLHACLVLAQDEYPTLDIASYEQRCDGYVQDLAPRLEGLESQQDRIAAINRFLFEEKGFAGNDDDYYDPRNSYINDVFDRRLGIPLSLGVIQIELARRLGVPLEGVSFPGHFLVRLPIDDGIIVLDPYNGGRPLNVQELRDRAKPHLGGQTPDDRQLLQILSPASHRDILMRMLRNLKGVYAEREDFERALRCSDRLVGLDPSLPEEYRDRGLMYLRVEHMAGARSDLAHYLKLAPEAEDAGDIRDALLSASSAGGSAIH